MSTPLRADEVADFERLVTRVQEPLWRFLLRRADPDTAADVLGDTLLVLWRRRADVPTDDPLPWSYGVARGALANAIRGQRRQVQLVNRIALVTPPHDVDVPSEGIDDPALDRAWSRLVPLDREVLRLWAWEGLAPREIAIVLDVSANAAGLRMRRAIARLRAELT